MRRLRDWEFESRLLHRRVCELLYGGRVPNSMADRPESLLLAAAIIHGGFGQASVASHHSLAMSRRPLLGLA